MTNVILVEGQAMRATLFVCGCSLLVALTGCDIQQIAQPPAGTQQGPTNVGAAAGVAVDGGNFGAAPAPVAPMPVAPATGAAPIAPGTTPAAPVPGVTPPPAPGTQTIPAGVGVGQAGRSLDEYEGVVVTPVKSLFATRERLVFEVQIPQALQLFNAVEGRNPKTHDEFMEKIVKANQIQLPELPPNNRYIYDPTTNELMVEQPKLKAAAPQ